MAEMTCDAAVVGAGNAALWAAVGQVATVAV